MPLYDILNEFQKGSSHMAAVVKAKTGNTVSNAVIEKSVGNKYPNGNHQLTVPLLSELDEESDSFVVEVDNAANTMMHKQTLIPKDGATVTNVADSIEDEEVIGIITLEDVFEELLQVKYHFLTLSIAPYIH